MNTVQRADLFERVLERALVGAIDELSEDERDVVLADLREEGEADSEALRALLGVTPDELDRLRAGARRSVLEHVRSVLPARSWAELVAALPRATGPMARVSLAPAGELAPVVPLARPGRRSPRSLLPAVLGAAALFLGVVAAAWVFGRTDGADAYSTALARLAPDPAMELLRRREWPTLEDGSPADDLRGGADAAGPRIHAPVRSMLRERFEVDVALSLDALDETFAVEVLSARGRLGAIDGLRPVRTDRGVVLVLAPEAAARLLGETAPASGEELVLTIASETDAALRAAASFRLFDAGALDALAPTATGDERLDRHLRAARLLEAGFARHVSEVLLPTADEPESGLALQNELRLRGLALAAQDREAEAAELKARFERLARGED